MKFLIFLSTLAIVGVAGAQSQPVQDQTPVPAQRQKIKKEKVKKENIKKGKSTAADIGGGVGSAAGGVAKGAGSAASGVGKGAVDLATLHPLDAGVAVGTGAAKAGKDVTVGSVKGVGKIGKGVGHAFKKIV